MSWNLNTRHNFRGWSRTSASAKSTAPPRVPAGAGRATVLLLTRNLLMVRRCIEYGKSSASQLCCDPCTSQPTNHAYVWRVLPYLPRHKKRKNMYVDVMMKEGTHSHWMKLFWERGMGNECVKTTSPRSTYDSGHERNKHNNMFLFFVELPKEHSKRSVTWDYLQLCFTLV
jgi:hypothetical protein